MKSFKSKKTILCSIAFGLILALQSAAAQQLPNPVLAFTGQEQVDVGGKQFIRYRYDVANKDEYPADMFAPAPNLPPCGQNAKSARSWVEIYDQRGKRLQGFCAFTKPADLDKLWFTLESEIVPPSYVYIEITDRQTGTKYKSNLADTTN
jgi:hypothetical protein